MEVITKDSDINIELIQQNSLSTYVIIILYYYIIVVCIDCIKNSTTIHGRNM